MGIEEKIIKQTIKEALKEIPWHDFKAKKAKREEIKEKFEKFNEFYEEIEEKFTGSFHFNSFSNLMRINWKDDVNSLLDFFLSENYQKLRQYEDSELGCLMSFECDSIFLDVKRTLKGFAIAYEINEFDLNNDKFVKEFKKKYNRDSISHCPTTSKENDEHIKIKNKFYHKEKIKCAEDLAEIYLSENFNELLNKVKDKKSLINIIGSFVPATQDIELVNYVINISNSNDDPELALKCLSELPYYAGIPKKKIKIEFLKSFFKVFNEYKDEDMIKTNISTRYNILNYFINNMDSDGFPEKDLQILFSTILSEDCRDFSYVEESKKSCDYLLNSELKKVIKKCDFDIQADIMFTFFKTYKKLKDYECDSIKSKLTSRELFDAVVSEEFETFLNDKKAIRHHFDFKSFLKKRFKYRDISYY